ncbi:MAG TPA: pentapeptide repeat-containing protein [Micropepsaceae bacterium]|nr:pentapeptide repeat-containing protein [Micropepsaceae bacterium]
MDHLVRGRRVAVLSMLSVSMIPILNHPAFAAGALPTGGNFVAGSGGISGTASQLTVNQTTQRGIINWSGFSIGQGNSVKIDNGSGATLNRVTGSAPSSIAGSLSSTGSTYIINQNGVVVTPTGKVLTGGSFVASTRDTNDPAFMAGQTPEFTGTSAGAVANQGTIKSSNGDVVLIGKSATNSGSVSAPNGTAGVVAGDDVLLQPSGSGLQIEVKAGSGDATNSGNIAAVQAVINAVGGNAYALAGNNGGVVRATGTKTVNGHVWLTAGGSADLSGSVSAHNADGSGGAIDVQGSNINVSGTLNANAVAPKGDGGKITVGSKAVASTSVSGTVEARAGAQGGNGGSIETSGEVLNIGGATVNASAPKGSPGTWSLDPYDLTVDATAASSINTTLGSDTNVNLQTTASGTSGPGTPNPSGNGDIFINSVLSWNTPAALSISAYRNIDVNANVTVGGGGTLSLTTGSGGSGDYIIANGASIQFTGGAGAGAGLVINGTTYTLIYDMTGLQNINSGLTGNYALATPLDATNVSSWIPLGTNPAALPIPYDQNYSVLNSEKGFSGILDGLGNAISNLTVNQPSAQFVSLFGFSTGTVRDIGLIGFSVAGDGNGGGIGGLVAANSGAIENSYAIGSVTGDAASYAVGGLVGTNDGTITNSHSSGTVSGGGGYYGGVGGLVGANGGTITNSWSSAAVSGGNYVGGLVGSNNNAISNSHATGTVNGISNVGGLVGYNTDTGDTTISNSYATGAVSGDSQVGGLVGYNWGTISSSYATGAVSGDSQVGGLVGVNDAYCNPGTITDSFATGAVSGTEAVGGLVGVNNGSVFNSSSTGAVTGNDYVGGLVGADGIFGEGSGNTISGSWSSGRVTGISIVGGFAGSEYSNTGANNYWNLETSGQSTSAGNEVGLTTAQLQGALPGGFDPTVWGTGAGLYPYFLWQYPSGTPQAVKGIAYSDRGVTALSSGAAVSVLVNGTNVGSASSGANGYYYVLLAPGTIPNSNGQVLSYLSSSNVTGNSLADNANDGVSGLDIYGNTLRVVSSGNALSALTADLNTAAGSNSGAAFLFNPGSPLSLKSGVNLEIDSSAGIGIDAPVTTSGGSVTLAANTAGSGGAVDVEAPISTNGGNLVIGGRANPAATAAAGTASHPNGVEVHGALNAGTGAITINGQGFAGAIGNAMGIDVSAPVTTSGSNPITLVGAGGGSGASNQNYGVNVANVISATGSGAISLNGTGGDSGGSGASNHGVVVTAGSGVTATSLISGSGDALSITGTASNSSGGGNYGIYTTSKISNSGPISLSANSMSIGASIDPPAATVTLQPLTPSLAVNVGGTSDPGNGLFLSSASLSEISANALVIGNPNDTGPLTVTGALTTASGGALQNVSGLTLSSGSGQISVNAPITVTGSSPFNIAVNSGTPITYGATGVISATGPGILNATINGLSAATNFSGANLAGANLNGDNLSGVNLSGSNLSKANLNKANLTNANLLNADLTGANFNNAVWTGATVSDSGTYTPPALPAGTNWSGLNLSGRNLSGMNLAGYNLSGSNLSGANLAGANLTGANLSGVNLSGAVLFGANFTNADLQGVNLLGVIIQ